MVEASLLATAGATGTLLLAVLFVTARNRYRHPTLQSDDQHGTVWGRVFETLDSWSTNPASWFAAFLLLTVGVGGVVVLAVVGSDPFANPLLYLAAAMAAIGVVYGTYVASRNAGYSTAGSTLVTGTFVGIVILLSVVGLLLTW